MADDLKPNKTLKQAGVPLGARIVFRLQWLPFMALVLCLALTMPVAFLLYVFAPDAVLEFVDGCCDVLEERLEDIREHRTKVVAMYAEQGADHA